MNARTVLSVFLSEKPTGLGIYTREVLKEIVPFLNQESFRVLLSESQQENNLNINCPVFVRDRTTRNPFLRSLYLNSFKSSFFYSLTHHGQVNCKGAQIITIHDLIPLYFPQQYRMQYYYYKYYLPKVVKNSDLIITISESTKQDIMKFYSIDEKRIKVIYNGYNHFTKLENSVDGPKFEKPYVLMVGATFPHKNIHSVIEAYKKIYRKVDFDCIIVGKESNYFNYLKKFIHENELSNRVHILGYVNDRELSNLYINANMFIYPSLYEGFGLPILEAMHYNIPTAIAKTSSLPEVAGDASVQFNPHNIDEISSMMMELYNSNALRNKLIKKGTENLKRFSWKKTGQDIIAELKRFL